MDKVYIYSKESIRTIHLNGTVEYQQFLNMFKLENVMRQQVHDNNPDKKLFASTSNNNIVNGLL